MSDTESFEQAMSEMADKVASPYWIGMADRLKRAHDHEIRDTTQQQYHRGYEDGRHSMDAEHAAVAMRLRGLRFDGGSHENLSSIAYAIYPCATGWTCESADGLRDKLIDLMGGVSDGLADDSDGNADSGDSGRDIHFDGLSTYDELGNERQKAVCELRKIHTDAGGFVKALAKALGVEWQAPRVHQTLTIVRDRLIHLLGGDRPSGIDVLREMDADGTCPNDVPTSSITDELRRWASDRHCKGMSHTDVLNIGLIADRIDERARLVDTKADIWRDYANQMREERDEFKRAAKERADLIESMARDLDETELERDELRTKLDKANGENKGLRLSVDEQKESIAQRKKTIKKLVRDNEKLQKQRDELQAKLDSAEDAMNRAAGRWAKADAECRELQAKLDGYDSTHVELPRDANGNVFRVGCTVRMVERHPEVLLTVHSMTLCDDGMWRLYAWDDEDGYSCNLSTSEFEACDRPRDSAESIVRELTLGTITESQAIGRIEALHAEP